MSHVPSLDELWEAAPPGARPFEPGQLARLPEPAQRYLRHAIAPGTPLASAVRLRMRGEIKLQGWLPFSAEQVIRWGRGMIWRATVRMHGLPIRGFDRLVDGEGEMKWKLLGLVPIMTASGPDITRSAAGRVEAESVWLPSVLCGEDVSWSAPDMSQAHARLAVAGESTEVAFAIGGGGELQSVKLKRWGNPEGAAFHAEDFGCLVESEGTFGGYTLPTRLRVGWYIGTPRFDAEGEFFRCSVEHAEFR